MRRIIIFAIVMSCLSIFTVVAFAETAKKTPKNPEKQIHQQAKKRSPLQTKVVKLEKKYQKSKKQLKQIKQAIERAILKASKRYNLSPKLIRALIQEESGGGIKGVYAISRRNAKGLTQLLPGTAKEMGVKDPFDIEQNIIGGSRYLKQLLDQFDNIYLGLIAYNWGPGNTERALRGQKHLPTSVRRYATRIIKAISKT